MSDVLQTTAKTMNKNFTVFITILFFVALIITIGIIAINQTPEDRYWRNYTRCTVENPDKIDECNKIINPNKTTN